MKRGRGDQNRIALLSRRRDDLERLCTWAKRLVALSQKADALRNRLAALKQRVQLAQRNEWDQFRLNQVSPDLYHQRYVLLERFAGQRARLEGASKFRDELAGRIDRHRLAIGIQRALEDRDRLAQSYENLRERFETARLAANSERERLSSAIEKGNSALAYFTTRHRRLTTELEKAQLNAAAKVDPERLAAISSAVEETGQRKFLPLVRGKQGFAIHPDFATEDDLVTVDRFEAEPATQDLYAAKWKAMIDAVKRSYKGAEREPALETADLLRPAGLEPELQAVVELVAFDQEVQLALQQTLASWHEELRLKANERKKQAEQKALEAKRRHEAISSIKARVREETERLPRGRPSVRAISVELEKVFAAAEAGNLSITERDGSLLFRSRGNELRRITPMVVDSPIGRYALSLLRDEPALNVPFDFSLASWANPLPQAKQNSRLAPTNPSVSVSKRRGWERE